MKRFILIAGANGVGKSTLYHSIEGLSGIERVNADEIVEQLGDWRDPKIVFRSGKIAANKVKTFLSSGTTFNQESTLCGRSIISTLHSAKELGYYIEMHYVGVNSVETAKERIRNRVALGGHGIPERDIERRYEESRKNLIEVIPLCDVAFFYDNTESLELFARIEKGKSLELYEKVPAWFVSCIPTIGTNHS